MLLPLVTIAGIYSFIVIDNSMSKFLRKEKDGKNMKKRKILKTISLAVLGLGVLGGVIAVTNHFIQRDEKSITPSYEIGGLDANGKYFEDNSSIYTKERFACEGLKATLDFDSTINYQIFYYDILDNFISSSDVLTGGYSDDAPLNGAYARIEVTPLNDEDGKVSWSEKMKYSKQLNLKVSKNADANINKKYVSYKGNLFTVVNNFEDTEFEYGVYFAGTDFVKQESSQMSSTTLTLLKVDKGTTIKYDNTKFVGSMLNYFVFEELPKDNSKYTKCEVAGPEGYVLKIEKDSYVLIQVWAENGENVKTNTPTLPKLFSFEK